MDITLTNSARYDEQANFWDDSFLKEAIPHLENLLYHNKYSSVKVSPYLADVLKYVKKEDIVLESGCGVGQWLIFLAKEGYRNLYGIDFAQKTIAQMKTRFPEINFIYGDIRKTVFEDGYFDALLSWSVIDHLEPEDQVRALNDYFRILKHDGYLFITVPFKNILHFSPVLFIVNFLKKNQYLRKLLKLKPYKREMIQYFYTKRQIEKLLTDANFVILDVMPTAHEVGFARPINAHFLKNSKKFHRNKQGEWEGLTQTGQNLCDALKKISPWITPDEIFLLAQKKRIHKA